MLQLIFSWPKNFVQEIYIFLDRKLVHIINCEAIEKILPTNEWLTKIQIFSWDFNLTYDNRFIFKTIWFPFSSKFVNSFAGPCLCASVPQEGIRNMDTTLLHSRMVSSHNQAADRLLSIFELNWFTYDCRSKCIIQMPLSSSFWV